MSLSPAVLDALLAAGATAEMIVAAVKADAIAEEQRLAERRAKDAERQRKSRESRSVTVTPSDTTDTPCPPLDKEKSPTPPKEINPPLTPGDLEADASCPSGDEREPENDNHESLKPEHIVEAWNDLAQRLGKPCVRSLTPERRTRVKARIAGYSLEDFREVLGNVERSPFLRGERDWQGCTFDWITQKSNFQKILEGNYNNG